MLIPISPKFHIFKQTGGEESGVNVESFSVTFAVNNKYLSAIENAVNQFSKEKVYTADNNNNMRKQ